MNLVFGRLVIAGSLALALLVTTARAQQRPRANTQPVPPRGAQPRQPVGQRSPRPQGPARPPQGPARPPGQPIARPVMAPNWYPLPAADQKYIDDILAFWERHSQKINKYSCKFKRYEYMPVRLADGRMTRERYPTTLAEGEIMYERPDKGLFAVTKPEQRIDPVPAGKEPQYKTLSETEHQKWICDGQKIFEFDFRNKRLVETQLPPDVQGQQIVEGPLPFFFGASAAKIKQRYWVRAIPGRMKDKFWIEAVPKYRGDAADFRKIEVVLDNQEHLPEALILSHRDYSVTTYAFRDRSYKDKDLRSLLARFQRAFYVPVAPRGWKHEKQAFNPPAAGPPQPGPRAAARPPIGNAPRR